MELFATVLKCSSQQQHEKVWCQCWLHTELTAEKIKSNANYNKQMKTDLWWVQEKLKH